MDDSLIQVTASPRQVLGKKVSRRRAAGFVPGNIVLKGKPPVAVEISQAEIIRVLDQVGYTQAFELVVDKDKVTVLVTDVSFAPMQHQIPQHVVFSEVKKGERVHASIPLVLVGEAPGIQKGLMVLQIMDHVEVTSPALKIPERLEADISGLTEDGDVVRLADISIPAEIETETDLQTPVAKLEMSRSQVSQEADDMAEEDGEEAADQSEETAADKGHDDPAEKN